jgi:hypothetical protein
MMPRSAVAAANRDRADRYLAAVAAVAARRSGYPDIRALVAARTQAGGSLAAISRGAGLHKDWLSRHLGRLDPAAAAAVPRQAAARLDALWLAALRRLGFGDVAGYLRARHLEQHRTVNAIAAEVGLSRHAVEAALRRHGLARITHSAKRHAARQRAAGVAARRADRAAAAQCSRSTYRLVAGWPSGFSKLMPLALLGAREASRQRASPAAVSRVAGPDARPAAWRARR